jgi:hypothetical protein
MQPEFLDKFWNNTNFLKICPVGAELFHAVNGRTDGQRDRQTDLTKLIVNLRNFANELLYFIALFDSIYATVAFKQHHKNVRENVFSYVH